MPEAIMVVKIINDRPYFLDTTSFHSYIYISLQKESRQYSSPWQHHSPFWSMVMVAACSVLPLASCLHLRLLCCTVTHFWTIAFSTFYFSRSCFDRSSRCCLFIHSSNHVTTVYTRTNLGLSRQHRGEYLCDSNFYFGFASNFVDVMSNFGEIHDVES